MGPHGGEPVAHMVTAFRERRDYLVQRLGAMPGVRQVVPTGAFYVLPEVSAFCGPGAHGKGFGPVPDVDALCRCALGRAAP